MHPNLKLSDKAFILIAVPLVFQVLFVATLAYLLKGAEEDASREAQSREIVSTSERLAKCSQEAGVIVYLYKRFESDSTLRKYKIAKQMMSEEAAKLAQLSSGDSEERLLAGEILDVTKKGTYFADQVIDGARRHEIDPEEKATRKAREGVMQFSGDLLRDIHELADYEQKSSERQSLAGQQKRQFIWDLLIAGLIFNFGLAVFLAGFFNAATSTRLKTLMDNSLRLATGQELNPLLKGKDEIAKLDEVFHRMAGALSEAQRKERAIIENALDVICSVAENMTFADVSPACRAVFGYEPVDLIGKRIIEIIPSEQTEKLSKMFRQVKTGEAGPILETQIRRPDKSLVDVRWSVYWAEQEHSYFCVARDITAERQVERLKQEFVSMISHDLRTPLMSVQASLYLLSAGAKGTLSEGVAKNLAQAERNVNYIISLINSLLDVERIASDKLELNCTTTDLSEIIDTAAQAVKPIAEVRSIKVECLFTDAEVYVDSGRMIQVMINLLSNALKFSQDATVIRVVAQELGDDVEVQVIDQGRGIPATHLQSIFGRFEQVEATDSTQKGGSGLGLAICKAIVEAHGGTIGVESEPEKGSKFWFRLPLHAAVKAQV